MDSEIQLHSSGQRSRPPSQCNKQERSTYYKNDDHTTTYITLYLIVTACYTTQLTKLSRKLQLISQSWMLVGSTNTSWVVWGRDLGYKISGLDRAVFTYSDLSARWRTELNCKQLISRKELRIFICYLLDEQ